MGAGEAAAITAALLAAGAPREPAGAGRGERDACRSRAALALTLAELPRISAYGFEGPTVIMLGAVFAPALAGEADSGALPLSRTA